MKTPRGLIARVAIQCKHPETHDVGTFIFSGESHKADGAAKSPCLPSVYDLAQWCKANGWNGYGPDYIYEPQR
jgi:hypothetical protein